MKYYKNDIYTLKCGTSIKTYQCIAIVKTILDNIVNIVIMKQIDGEISSKIFCLNKLDCRHLHIKYQTGLQVFSMNNNFKKLS